MFAVTVIYEFVREKNTLGILIRLYLKNIFVSVSKSYVI